MDEAGVGADATFEVTFFAEFLEDCGCRVGGDFLDCEVNCVEFAMEGFGGTTDCGVVLRRAVGGGDGDWPIKVVSELVENSEGWDDVWPEVFRWEGVGDSRAVLVEVPDEFVRGEMADVLRGEPEAEFVFHGLLLVFAVGKFANFVVHVLQRVFNAHVNFHVALVRAEEFFTVGAHVFVDVGGGSGENYRYAKASKQPKE